MNCNNSDNIRILRRDGTCTNGCADCCEAEENTNPLRVFCDTKECPEATNFCCEGIFPEENDGEARDIFAYVTQVIDSESVQGSLLNEMIRLTPQNSNFIAEFTDCNGCSCAQPVLDNDSEFKILASEVELNTAFLSDTLPANAFIINQYTPSEVNAKNKNRYEIALDSFNSQIYNDACTDDAENTSAPLIVVPGGTTVTYQASFVLCGSVTTHSGTYGFKFIIRMDKPMTTYHCTSFMLQAICLPIADGSGNARLIVNFSFDSQLVAPSLAVNCDNQLVFASALSIAPTMNAETVVNKKVILNVREENC